MAASRVNNGNRHNLRLGAFLGVFAIIATGEVFAPRRRLTTSKSRRWLANLAIVALNPLSVVLVYPILPVGLALLASELGWGLLNQWALPYGLEVLIGMAALDLVVYTQHVLHHAIPVLRLVVVTPDMHRVHHSVIIRETNSNYGFNLPWWDRLLGTYKAHPAKGHTDMVIGLSQFRDPQRLILPRLLILPFVGDPGRGPINRH
ncbi:MAG: sterol desaturase family protein [Desulfobacterales bacterium]|jgi:sterol desaturase/sphingolipid hydroxylase (fatty acid hydroxylase superfamily)|nr:sterol desaturase family protein [Desulfobacterales bacterium]